MLAELAVATGNEDKVREIALRLQGVVGVIHWLHDYPGFVMPPETGNTLRENAFIKAEALFKVAQIPTIADDTGLFVDALAGRPGVYSGRYAGENASYQENLDKLLLEMRHIPEDMRQASFRTEICCCWSGGSHFLPGVCSGRILTVPEATEGAFGYDPLFQPEESERPFSRMTLNEKNNVSHRGRALDALAQWLMNVDLKETGDE
jgi:XTP/dITP diphosphohydrolase